MNAIRLSLLTGVVMLGLFVPQSLGIIGGTVDNENTFSNVGAMVVAVPGSPPWVGGSGTLIRPRVFLTAGHLSVLTQQYPGLTPYLFISFGKYALDPDTWHAVEAGITHPDYDDLGQNNPHTNDVGVFILKEAIDDLPLANLPPKGFLDDLKAMNLLREPGQGGVPFTVAGYGTSLDWPPPEIVDADGWRRSAQTEYLTFTQSWLFTQQNPATGNGGTGFGDSGGPTFWIADGGTQVLVALTSRGNLNCVSTNIAWRVDLAETLDFIENVIATVEPDLP